MIRKLALIKQHFTSSRAICNVHRLLRFIITLFHFEWCRLITYKNKSFLMQHFYLIFLLRWLILFQHDCTSSVGCGTRTLVTLLYLRALPSLPQFSLSSDWLLVRETGAGTRSDWPVALEWSVRNSSQVRVMKSECIRQHEPHIRSLSHLNQSSWVWSKSRRQGECIIESFNSMHFFLSPNVM